MSKPKRWETMSDEEKAAWKARRAKEDQKHREANREKRLQSKRDWSAKYYRENREVMVERARKWRENNPEKVKEIQRKRDEKINNDPVLLEKRRQKHREQLKKKFPNRKPRIILTPEERKIRNAERARISYWKNRGVILEKHHAKRVAGEIATPQATIRRSKAKAIHNQVTIELRAMAGREQTPEDFDKLMRMMGGEP
jgi:hypothetical protein